MKAEARERAWEDIDEEMLRSSLRELDRRLKAKFGERYLKLILFGSRARGDHQPDSRGRRDCNARSDRRLVASNAVSG